MTHHTRRNRAFAWWLYCSFLAFALASNNIAAALQSGTIETYVGGGNGDGDAAVNATIDPRGLVIVGAGGAPDVYIADGKNNRVRRVAGNSGLIETVAGNGAYAYAGDGGEAQNASLRFPLDVAVDGAGNVYIADTFNHRIRKVGTDRRISTFAGNGQASYTGEGAASQVALNTPYGVTVGPDGNVYIADFGNNRIRRVSPPGCAPSSCVISTVVGNGTWEFSGDNGPATGAALKNPADVAFDGNGNMYIADRGNNRIRRVASNGIITTVAGGGQYGPGSSVGDGGPGTQAVLYSPSQVDTDSNGNVYVADTNHHRIRMLQAGSFIISTVAGTGATGFSGDGGAATAADLFNTWGIAVTTPGTFWLSQSVEQAASQQNRVRRVTSFGVIQSVIGGGLGDGGAALNALIDPRGGAVVDSGGVVPDLYFADGINNVVRRIDADTGIIHNIAGTGVAGYSGDGGLAVNATLRTPFDVALNAAASMVYIADTFNNVIRKISNGIITTAAGTGQYGYSGEGSATQENLAAPRGVDVDRFGNLYIADSDNNRVRKVTGSQISTIAGTGASGFSGDGGPATSATLKNPQDVAVADDGTLYIADAQSNRIRRVSSAGIITTFAGNGNQGFSGDLGLATLATLSAPTYLALDAGGNLFIADSQNNRVRRVDAVGLTIQTVAGNGQKGFAGDGGAATAASLGQPSGVAVDPSGRLSFISAKDQRRVRVVDGCAIVGPPQQSSALVRLWLLGPLALLSGLRRRAGRNGPRRGARRHDCLTRFLNHFRRRFGFQWPPREHSLNNTRRASGSRFRVTPLSIASKSAQAPRERRLTHATMESVHGIGQSRPTPRSGHIAW